MGGLKYSHFCVPHHGHFYHFLGCAGLALLQVSSSCAALMLQLETGDAIDSLARATSDSEQPLVTLHV